jgi:hypothetical protein
MAHLAPLATRVAESLRHFVFLDAGPYRLEGGVGREFMFAAALEMDGVGQKDYRYEAGRWGWYECARYYPR